MSKTYGPLENNEVDIEKGESDPVVRGKFKVIIDSLDNEHLKQIKIKQIKHYLSILLFIVVVLGVSGLLVYYETIQSNDEFKGYQKPNLYKQDDDIMKHMSGRIMGHHHRRRKCSDYVYGCCEIYYGPNQEKDYYEISPYRIVKQDERGSNCPFLKDLVEEFNINYKQDYQEGGAAGYCEINTTYDSSLKHVSGGKMYLVQPKDDTYGYNCNRIGDIVHMYENHWPQNETLMDLMFLSFIIGIICCAMSRK